LSYLYVLSIAAHRAGQKELDERATAQLIKAGEGSPEFHLFMGKAHLNLEQYDLALADFQAAAEANPNLTFVHFNLGLTYLKKQDYEHARDEFLKDAAVEPDLAFNYDELGDVYSLLQQDSDAEKSYREALRRDPRLVNSYLGWPRPISAKKSMPGADRIDSAGKLDPDRTDIHYVRGQILIHLGRKEEGKKELETSVRIDNEHRAERQKQVESGTVPSPELLQDEPYKNIYPGINLAYHGEQSKLEFDFIVAPESNPAPIDLAFNGVQHLATDASGNLIVSSGAGDVVLHKPVAYQQQSGTRQPVDVRFVLKADNQVGFELASYDRSRELVIDPTVTYATYLGGNTEDDAYAIAFDSTGAAYVTGRTDSTNFPTTSGAYATEVPPFAVPIRMRVSG
jgi:tetratricopeptide (TPR) repeat protein